jgi:hypothetical protein
MLGPELLAALLRQFLQQPLIDRQALHYMDIVKH